MLNSVDNGRGFLIGNDHETGKPQFYHGERGLVTIAAPGTGKTQCHMIPNLLKWRGPAIVLDVTGQLWKKTSLQRRKFGPVYRIDPDHPEESDHYNPFDYIRSDLRYIWQDARTLGKLVYTKQGAKEGGGHFFDLAGPDYIAVLACFIALKEPAHRRNFRRLNEYISNAPLDAIMAESLKVEALPGLMNAAGMLKRSDDRTKGNVTYTARNCIVPWDDPAVMEISRISDWHPRMIRDHNATVYICLSLEQLEDPALVRLIVGQHLRELMRYEVDRDRTPWVQFFIDEAPQLQNMGVLKQALEVGRNYNLRLWMLMQWRAQLFTAYGEQDGRGMIGACGLQAYMSPGMSDGLAADLSDQIGMHHNRLDGTQLPIYTAQQLAGPAFDQDVIAFDHGQFRRLRKRPVNRDSALQRLEGASA